MKVILSGLEVCKKSLIPGENMNKVQNTFSTCFSVVSTFLRYCLFFIAFFVSPWKPSPG